MSPLVVTLFSIAALAGLISTLWIVVESFRVSVIWGTVVMLVPFGSMVFLVFHWTEGKKPVLLQVASLLLAAGAVLAMPRTSWEDNPLTALLDVSAKGKIPPAAAAKPVPAPSSPAVAAVPEAATVQKALDALAPTEKELRTRSAAIDPKDAAAEAKLKADIAAYNAKLQPLLARKRALSGATPAPSFVVATPTPAPGWVADATTATIPVRPAEGQLGGASFQVETAELEGDRLSFRQSGKFGSESELAILFFLPDGETVAGRSWLVAPESLDARPHLQVSRPSTVEGVLPKTETYTVNYSLRIEFGAAANGEIPGRIYVCLPDAAKTFLAGNFLAKITR